MPNIGPVEIIVILLILLVVFGPKRIPELGRSVGQGMRNFKDSVTGRDRGDERGLEARTTTARPDPTGGDAAATEEPRPAPPAADHAVPGEAAAHRERARPGQPTGDPRA